MSQPLPNQLALTAVNDGDEATAAPLRNNFSAIQTVVNALRALFAGGTAGQVVTVIDGTDLELDYPPGHEIGYDQITASVPIPTGLTTVIPGSSHSFDGSPVIAEFFSEEVVTGAAAGDNITVFLYEGSTVVAVLGAVLTPAAAAAGAPMLGRARFTPTAGNHTYSIKAQTNAGTGSVTAGASVSASPAYLRFTKV